MRRVGLGLLVVAAIATIAQVLWFSTKLPDPVASHFGPNGQPDAWMSRTGFLAMLVLLQVGMAGFMLAIAYGMKWIPASLLNMPNKEYWLHPDRRDESLRKNGSMLILISGLTGIFLAVIDQLICETNVRANGPLPQGVLFLALGLYLVAVIGVAGYGLWSFRMPTDEDKEFGSARNDV